MSTERRLGIRSRGLLRGALSTLLPLLVGCGEGGDESSNGDPARDSGSMNDADGGSSAGGGPDSSAGSGGSGAGTSTGGTGGSGAGTSTGGSGAGTSTGGTSGTGGSDAGSPSGGFAEVVTRELYDEFFLHRDNPACEGGLFTYDALVAAAATFPKFCAEGDLETRRREAAAFLGNVSHETTGGWPTAPDGPYAWGLCFKEEVGCGGGACTGYCAPSAMWPCAPGQTYHGRGPMQLSWNYNYGQAGAALGLDLLNNPDLVTSDGVIAFRTAIWFWMTPQAPKPSCHDVMVGNWTPSSSDMAQNRLPGFGMTVNIINGGLECNIGPDSRVDDRIGFYTRYANLLGVDVGDNLDCANMTSY